MSDRDVIVTTEKSSGVGALVAGIIVALVILTAVWYFGIRGADESDVNINVDVPESVAPDS